MKTYTITESKAQLSALVEQVVKSGKPIVIGRQGRPMVQLVPYQKTKDNHRVGAFAGQIRISDDFNIWGPDESEAFRLTD